MTDKFTNVARGILEGLAGGPLPEWIVAEAATTLAARAPGEYLFHTGDSHPFVCCVRKGLVKLVYETSNGKEWIKAFSAEGGFFASASALKHGGCATFSVLAVETTIVEKLDYRVIQRLADVHILWQKTLSNAFQLYGARKEKRERELLTLSAEDRYRAFIAEYAMLKERIPQKDLARYLGVTPVGLSRIKSRVEECLSRKQVR
jgi:CRP-like cAMP-binding protein